MRERWIVLDNLQEFENSLVDLGAGHASPDLRKYRALV
jgi:hypothetical protein